jgi:cell division protease FtsH
MNIEIPNKEDSIKIIAHFLRNKPINKDVSAEFVASLLEGKSCAFLESVVNEAGLYAGYENLNSINKKHFIDAVIRLTTKHLPSKKMNDKERKMVCYHEAGHAVASILLGRKIALLTAKKYGKIGGFCSTYDYEEDHTFEEFKNEVIVMLSGKASTEIVYNTPDLGVESDIKKVTQLARYYIEKLAIKGFSYLYDGSPYNEKQPVKRVDEITDKISEMIEELYNDALILIKNNIKLLELIADALFEKEILVWEDICKLAQRIVA